MMSLQELHTFSVLPDRIVSEAVAAEYLGISRWTLKNIKGLRRIRVSDRRVGYKYSDLVAYVDGRVEPIERTG